jgi:hypothetical protein
MSVEAAALQHVRNAVDGVLALAGGLPEGGGVHEGAGQGTSLAFKALQQHANGHARGEGVRVDDEIGPAELGPGRQACSPGTSQSIFTSRKIYIRMVRRNCYLGWGPWSYLLMSTECGDM